MKLSLVRSYQLNPLHYSKKILFRYETLGSALASFFIFLYFFTSGADWLYFSFGLLKGKLSNVLSLLLATCYIAYAKKIYLDRNLLWVSAHLLVAIILSTAFSPYIARSIGYFAVYLIEFFLYFLLSYQLIFFYDHTKILKLYSIAFWLVGAHAFLQLFLSLFGIYDPFVVQFIGKLARPSSFMYEPSYYATYMTSFVAYKTARVLLDDTRSLQTKSTLSLLLLHIFYLISTSTSAFFSYFLFFPAMFVLKIGSFKRKIAPFFTRKTLQIFGGLTACLTVAGCIFPSIFISYFFKFFKSDFFLHHSFAERWRGITYAFRVFIDYPLFGRGIGGIGPHYFYEKNNIAEQTAATLKECELYDPTNVFTELLGTLGIFGTLGILFFVYLFWKSARKVISLKNLTREEKITAMALIASWVVVMLVLQFNPGIFRNYLWIHSGIVLGYAHKLIARTAHNTQQAHSS